MQRAYDDGKIIRNVTSLSEDTAGWLIMFSDNSSIRVLNGEDGQNGLDGKTPYLLVDQDGYWCISYDNGEHFTRLMNNQGLNVKAQGEKGNNGDGGVSVRVTVNENGYYVFELYKSTTPTEILETIATPYSQNPSYLISGITEDNNTHIVILTMSDGKTYTFNKVYNTPTSVAVLSNRVLLGKGSTASFEVRVNPSNATFNYDVSDNNCEITLDYAGDTRAFNSYVTRPSNYKITQVEQVYNSMGVLMAGQYRAYVTGLGRSQAYEDLIAVVLTVDNGNGEKVQISSSAFEIKYSNCLLIGFKFLKTNNGQILEDVETSTDGKNITITPPLFLTGRT